MVISINQPAYLPWLGYYNRILLSDAHVVLDHVQFEKNSFTNRNRIRNHGGSQWLTVPVRSKGKFGSLRILDVVLANETKWSKKHLESIRQNYGKTLYFDQYFPELELIYTRDWSNLTDLTNQLNRLILEFLGVQVVLHFSSEMDLSSRKSDLVLEICQKLGANTYLSGSMGVDYINESDFENSGINLIYQDYHHPIYKQYHGEFESHMCILDLLFNHGKKSRDILMEGFRL